jgi:hypothetical protein
MINMTGSKLSIFSHPGKITGYWITTRSFPYRVNFQSVDREELQIPKGQLESVDRVTRTSLKTGGELRCLQLLKQF